MASSRNHDEPNPDRLAVVREALRAFRDTQLEIAQTEERLKQMKAAALETQHQTLPDLFSQAGITNLGLEAEGNLPAYQFTAKPYYHASIASSWPPERREEAFDYLNEVGAGDMIKHGVTVLFSRGEGEKVDTLQEFLRKHGMPFTVDRVVPWNTLTAWVRSEVEKYKRIPDLEKIGAQVGRIVEIKQAKEK